MKSWEIDFSVLKRINPDTVGWIRLSGTPIDYPIVQARQGDYWLTHNFSDEESKHGAICLDANPSKIFPDRQNRLRGHNMSDGSMFRALTSYLDPEFCAGSPPIEIISENGTYAAQVWAVISVPYSEEYLSIVPADLLGFEIWRNIIEKRSVFHGSVTPAFGSKNLVLCTCQTEGEDGLAHGDVLVFTVLIPHEKEMYEESGEINCRK